MRDRARGTDSASPSSAGDRDMQVRLARINAASGLVGALLGAAVALVVALTQLNAQDTMVGRQIEQDEARFLRDNRLDAYAASLDSYAQLNSRLAAVAHAGSVDVQLEMANELNNQSALARQVSTRAQLLAPTEIQLATQALNKAYLDYIRVLLDDLRQHLRQGGALTDRPPAPTDAQTTALGAKGERYDDWLALVRESLAADDP
jgi:hypothetical protein